MIPEGRGAVRLIGQRCDLCPIKIFALIRVMAQEGAPEESVPLIDGSIHCPIVDAFVTF